MCKEYLPHKLSALQDEYDRTVLSRGSHDAQTLMNQARQWEESGEYSRAVECYMKVSNLKHSTNQCLLCDFHYFLLWTNVPCTDSDGSQSHEKKLEDP